MDCSSFKILHELGLDPCKRGRFISSITYLILYYIIFVRKDQIIIVSFYNNYLNYLLNYVIKF